MKILEGLTTNHSAVNASEVPNLIKTLATLKFEFIELQNWGEKFGVVQPAKKARRVKKEV